MVTRIGHMGLRVPDLDAAVDFQREVIGTGRDRAHRAASSYLTCNERHHELILIQDPVAPRLRPHRPRGPGRSARSSSPGNALPGGGRPAAWRCLRRRARHRSRTACPGAGGPRVQALLRDGDRPEPEPGDRPVKFEHVSVKVRNPRPLERFLEAGLGFRFSDRMGTVRKLVALRRRPPRDGRGAGRQERALALRLHGA